MSHAVWNEKLLEKLVGKRIDQVLMRDKDFLQFKIENEFVTCYADGDCCSYSWIEHINGLECLLGEVVNKVVVREMPESEEIECDVIRYYGWTLETNKGRFDIEMRNASNGYGGSLESHEYVKCQPITENF